jgi:hypothetical protein
MEPIYNLIIRILSMNESNTILCWIDLKTNDSTDNSTIENTNNCIDNIAENSPINCMNLQEIYFNDNFFPKKAPLLSMQTSFTILDYLPSGQNSPGH